MLLLIGLFVFDSLVVDIQPILIFASLVVVYSCFDGRLIIDFVRLIIDYCF